MPWIDYEGMGRGNRMLVWLVVIVIAVGMATVLWRLGVREVE